MSEKHPKVILQDHDGLWRDENRNPEKVLKPEELERFHYFRDAFYQRYSVWPDEIMLETSKADKHWITYIHCVAVIPEDQAEIHTRDVFKITLPINLGTDRKASQNN